MLRVQDSRFTIDDVQKYLAERPETTKSRPASEKAPVVQAIQKKKEDGTLIISEV